MSDYESMVIARDIAEIMQLLLQHGIDPGALTLDNLAWSTEGCDEGDIGKVVLLPMPMRQATRLENTTQEAGDSQAGTSGGCYFAQKSPDTEAAQSDHVSPGSMILQILAAARRKGHPTEAASSASEGASVSAPAGGPPAVLA